VRNVPGVTSALAERLTGGRYIEVNIDRDAAARYGMNIEDVQSVVTAAIGGETIDETVEGLQRFPISVRYPRELRDSLSDLRELPIVTAGGAQITLGSVADLRITSGPPMLRSENARLSGWIYVDLRGRLVVICEVKARRTDAYGVPAEAVTPAKQRRIRRLAVAWLDATGTHGVDLRFDVASLLGNDLTVIEDAF
jgi:Cu/Ag efflux pump CusA